MVQLKLVMCLCLPSVVMMAFGYLPMLLELIQFGSTLRRLGCCHSSVPAITSVQIGIRLRHSRTKKCQLITTKRYQAVHIRATPSIATGLDAIRILAKITDCFENHLHNINPEHTPWRPTDAPDEFIRKMCQALVAINLDVIDIQAAFKLSQNKDAQNRQGIIDGLSRLNTHESQMMAALVAIAERRCNITT